jgi:hypothetical protein
MDEIYQVASRIAAALINAGYIKKGQGETPIGPKKAAVKEALELFEMVHEELKAKARK